jgi:hypothetical protein
MRWGKRKKQSSSDGKSAEPAKPHVKSMSDDELKSAINRLKMEKEYATLTAPQVSAGRKIVMDMLKDIGKQQAKNYINRELGKLVSGEAKVALNKPVVKATPAVASRQVMKFNPNHGLKL